MWQIPYFLEKQKYLIQNAKSKMSSHGAAAVLRLRNLKIVSSVVILVVLLI